MKTPQFSTPTIDQVNHWLRPLGWDGRMTGVQMTVSAGNKTHEMYSLSEALLFAFGTNWDAPLLNEDFKGTINWIDIDRFVQWVRDVVGDTELAEALSQPVGDVDFLMGKIRAIEPIVTARVQQYRAVRDAAAGVAAPAAAPFGAR